jgi:hypothetical protein
MFAVLPSRGCPVGDFISHYLFWLTLDQQLASPSKVEAAGLDVSTSLPTMLGVACRGGR